MVYALYGRTGIYMMQEYCRLLGITYLGLGFARAGGHTPEVAGNPSNCHRVPWGHRRRSFRGARRRTAPSQRSRLHCAATLFVAQSAAAWPSAAGSSRLPTWLNAGWSRRFVDAARLAALPAPQQHAAVELLRGTMFRHNLIAYRDDRSDANRAIDFLAMVGACSFLSPYRGACAFANVCLAGFVAVLINRAHAFTDLVLTVDAFENRLLGAIDGRRTLAEILAVAGDRDEERSLGFFQRLWQYNPVVFDASRSDASRA